MNDIVKQAKSLLQGKVVFKPEPSIEDLFYLFHEPKSQRAIDHNDSVYVSWLKKVLEDYNTNNVLCLYMNKENMIVLDKNLNPMVYLNYSPREDNSLEDDKLMIDLNEAHYE